jgi:alkanesulfonate monooxygenase SsuD/methylene tetrahydromethanopterin reductase-like flavin-dependent oxidoreductase (luciferase family)
MQFGYFTLSDNHYDDNIRAPNHVIADIIDEAVYAEDVGLHSAWIGEHHFSTLGVLSCRIWCLPMSRREHGASVSLLPSPFCHCIIRSASPSNGRHSIC